MQRYILQSERRIPTKLIDWAENHKRWNSAHSYWEAYSKPFLLTMTERGRDYPWHTDSHNMNGPKNDRLWTRILYLTHGSSINFGLWGNRTGYVTTDTTGSSIPTPDHVHYSLRIYPGLQVEFPSFFIHSVPVQESEQHRWTIVAFLEQHPTEEHEELWNHAYAEYFKNFTFARP